MSDLPKRLRIKASMIALGERIAWGSDTALMEEAADVIEALSASVENHQLHMLGMARDRDQLRAMLTAQPQASYKVPCKTHPDAPHGFCRNSSHTAGRYVCECEHWEEPQASAAQSAPALSLPAAVPDGVDVVAWRIEHPAKQRKVYEQRQEWSYQQYGNIKYEVQDLMTVAQHERIDGQRLEEIAQLRADLDECDGERWKLRTKVQQLEALSAQQSKSSTVTRDQIREVFMRNGFTVKEGQTDLKPYVYAAAQELLALVDTRQSAHVSVPRELVERSALLLTDSLTPPDCCADFDDWAKKGDQAAAELRALLNGGEA